MTKVEATAVDGDADRGQHTHVAAARFRAEAGSLYVVATPLGNLRDVTLRALDVLASADRIAAEDTRTSAILLRHYGIMTRPVALHAHNEDQKLRAVAEWLRAGHSVALISDAGTPAISDPGARLVHAVRAAGFPVVPIPGPSAVIAAVSAAGLDAAGFVFVGFLPAQVKARRSLLEQLAVHGGALVFYEAPHRVVATIADLALVLGGDRELVIAREITKKFESIVRLPLAGAAAWIAAEPQRQRGEFVLIVDSPVAAAVPEGAAMAPGELRWLQALLEELPPARAARVVAAVTGLSREDVYARALALKRP
ncbi:MAG: 16S rRNA (cytidine(1402)-2'-O)-methyltransferase [Casimicrobiaceae bacterium]